MGGVSLEALRNWGGWTSFFVVVIWWIRGMPERRRAQIDADKVAIEGEQLRRQAIAKAETDLRESYAIHFERLTRRMDKMEAEHDEERRRHEEEREQWRLERQQLLDHVAGLERKLASYGSSALHLVQEGPVTAPTTTGRLASPRKRHP
jgi:hypothetical protein